MSAFSRGVDALLEASVLGSFTRLGSLARSRLDHWVSLEGKDLQGRVVVITGATSGLGLVTARALARLGASIEVVARNAGKADALCAQLRKDTGNPNVRFVVAELGHLASVRSAAAELQKRNPAIDVLIHNAGALDDVRHTTPEGLEQTVACHVVGPFLLSEMLRPQLCEAALKASRARVLWVSSGGMYSERLDVSRLELAAEKYDGTLAYARAKRAQVTLAALQAERFTPDGIVVQTMHPGWADTPGVARSLPVFRKLVGGLLRSPEEGADTLIWLAADDGEPLTGSGRFWHDRRPRALHRLASTARTDTPQERQKLWDWVVAASAR